ncbi:unnamed protein product [Nezara viridula]|uniref:Uncharacterized protein n=1 Tax=Nezara viridula TaxID=85310 RepID=A0A9P0HI12_NEZVI|nr:unnamed protein product [Nezara viridula]
MPTTWEAEAGSRQLEILHKGRSKRISTPPLTPVAACKPPITFSTPRPCHSLISHATTWYHRPQACFNCVFVSCKG